MITFDSPQAWLHVAGVGMIRHKPNWWRRFWAWALLGWIWEPHREMERE